jgi:hypothetical protein
VTSQAYLEENRLNVERLTFTSELWRHIDYKAFEKFLNRFWREIEWIV